MQSSSVSPQKKEFYKDFFIESKSVVCNINKFRVIENQYTIYEIEAKTNEFEWIINKRYKDFYNLYQKLKKSEKSLKNIDFPEKKWFGNLKINVLLERKSKLNNFLEYILSDKILSKNIEVLNFLKIEEIYIEKGYYTFKKLCQLASTASDETLLSFLVKININQDTQTLIFNEIEHYIFDESPFFSEKVIQLFLFGDHQLKGLLEICGYVEPNHFNCNRSLRFLFELMTHEKNPEADSFIQVFQKLHLKQLSQLNLGKHILFEPNKQCKIWAFKIFDLYLQGNANLPKSLLEILLENSLEEFEKWKDNRVLRSQKTECFTVEDDNICSNASIAFEEIKIKSATLRHKMKSPLFRRPTKSIKA